MNTKSEFYCRLLLILTLVATTVAVEKKDSSIVSPYDIRAIYTCPHDNGDSLSVNLLKRAKKNNYTHVIAEYFILHKDDWEDGVYRHSHSGKLYQQLKNDFQTAGKEGLRLIPLFQTGNGHSEHWRNTKNRNIQWEILHDGKESNMPAMAPDSLGFDKSYKELIRVIAEAYKDAKPGYPLEYIHLGHDEAVKLDGKLHLLIGTSNADKQWLKNKKGKTVQYLMVEEIRNRVNGIKDLLPTTKVMIWADMWDREQNGGVSTVNTANAITIAGKDPLLVNNLIFLPWQYTKEFYGKDYDTYRAFRHFTNNGFKILITGCAANGDNSDELITYVPQMIEGLLTSQKPEFNSLIIGYLAIHWDNYGCSTNPGYDRDPSKACYMAIEFMTGSNFK